MRNTSNDLIALPESAKGDPSSLESILVQRASVREFRRKPLSLAQVGQLLWAAQGINRPGGYRTAPSAGALYPLEVLVAAGQVSELKPGVYRYHPREHALALLGAGDVRADLAAAALDQTWMSDAPVVFVITAVFERNTVKYGQRGYRYVYMEVGHTSQNIYLQAAALGLGTVAVGAFYDTRVQQILSLPGSEQPLCLMPTGLPA